MINRCGGLQRINSLPREARLAGRLSRRHEATQNWGRGLIDGVLLFTTPAALGLSSSVAGNYPTHGFHDPCYPKPYQQTTPSGRATSRPRRLGALERMPAQAPTDAFDYLLREPHRARRLRRMNITAGIVALITMAAVLYACA